MDQYSGKVNKGRKNARTLVKISKFWDQTRKLYVRVIRPKKFIDGKIATLDFFTFFFFARNLSIYNNLLCESVQKNFN